MTKMSKLPKMPEEVR